MTDHKAARERCATFLKEKTEAVDPQDLPVLDECSICLENFVLEQSVRIKIEGCNHIFGRNCLTAILTNNPRLEKKCPLCRTVWIAAPARTPSEAPSDLYQSFVNRHSHRLLLSNFLTAEPNSREFAASQGLAPPQVSPFGSRTVGSRTEVTSLPSGPVRVFGRPPNGVINLIDSDDDADPLESFNAITRDINSVRERARNTQGSRRQRKEDKKKDAAAPNSRRTTTVNREIGSSNGQRQEQEQPTPFPTSIWNPTQRARPTPQIVAERTQMNWGLPNRNQNGNKNGNQPAALVADHTETAAMDVDDDGTAQSSQQNPPRRLLLAESSPHESTQGLPRHGCPPMFGPRSSSLRQNQRSRVPPNPFLLSPTPENDTVETANMGSQAQLERQERLDQRAVELHELEKRLNNREQGLDARESILTTRDRMLTQQEGQFRQREGNDTRLGVIRQRQLQELEVVLARHREELVVMLRRHREEMRG